MIVGVIKNKTKVPTIISFIDDIQTKEPAPQDIFTGNYIQVCLFERCFTSELIPGFKVFSRGFIMRARHCFPQELSLFSFTVAMVGMCNILNYKIGLCASP